MKRFRNAGAFLGFVFAVAGCGHAPEGNSVPAGGEPANPGAARSPVTGSSRDTAAARAASTGPDEPSVPALPQTSKWELDPENSSVGFVCKHVFTNVRGMFPKPSGTILLDEATPANSKVNVTIGVSSITTGVEERDTHLKGPDFFDVAKYPVITFASTSFSKSSATSYSVTGNLAWSSWRGLGAAASRRRRPQRGRRPRVRRRRRRQWGRSRLRRRRERRGAPPGARSRACATSST
jgi:YceI-like domain